MFARLIRWLARSEIERARTLTLELRQQDYNNGFMMGRNVGQGEMLMSLRGDPEERATAEMVRRAAASMVH